MRSSCELICSICYYIAYGLWTFVFRSFGILWVLPRCIPELFFGWRNWLGKNHSQIWNLVSSCIFWTLWREQNNRTFKNAEHTESQLYELFANTLYDWATVWGYSSSNSVLSFLDSLHLTSLSSPFVILLHSCVHSFFFISKDFIEKEHSMYTGSVQEEKYKETE